MTTVAEFADYLNEFTSTSRAAEWDNVGLILGERSARVRRVITCLTVTPPVVEEAIAVGANLIVTHHPILFRPVQKITDQTADGRVVLALDGRCCGLQPAHGIRQLRRRDKRDVGGQAGPTRSDEPSAV